MKEVFVDATPLVRNNFDGVSRYSKSLIQAFTELYGEEYRLLLGGFVGDRTVDNKILLPRRIYSGLFKLFSLDIRTRHDIGLYLNFVIFPKRARRSVVVVHDLSYLDRPAEVSYKNQKFLEKFVARSVRQADRVIAISEFTKQRVQEIYELPPEKVSVVYCGVDADRFVPTAQESKGLVQSKYKLPAKFILCFGSIEPRKNLEGTLEGYGLMDEKVRKSYPLVLAGGQGWLNDSIHKKIKQLRDKGCDIVMTGYIDEDDVPSIYRLSSALLFPSHYEGFGMPILEAQASGIPVLTSNRSPMKDIAGAGALLCEPDDPESIAKSLNELLSSSSLRSKLTEAGLANSKRYSWHESARHLKQVLDNLSVR